MPLDEDLILDIENGKIDFNGERGVRERNLTKHGLDYNEEVRKIWCFGPDFSGPNILID